MDPDIDLLERWRAGDRRAGSELLQRHFKGLRLYFVARIAGDPADLIQDTFERMVRSRDRFEGRSTLRTYLYHIARNVLRETLRKRHRPQGDFDPISESVADVSGRTQSSILAQSEELQLLLDALRNIKSEQQDIIELHYFHRMTMVEVAEVVGIPVGTLKTRMGVARRRLAEAFTALLGQPREDLPLEQFLEQLRESVELGRVREVEPPEG